MTSSSQQSCNARRRNENNSPASSYVDSST